VDKLEALNAEGCEVMGQPFSRPQVICAAGLKDSRRAQTTPRIFRGGLTRAPPPPPPRRQGMLWGWWSRMHPFVGCPTFQQIKELPRADGVAALLDEATIGLGRIVALYDRSSALYQIH
jgi:hypothetical protein